MLIENIIAIFYINPIVLFIILITGLILFLILSRIFFIKSPRYTMFSHNKYDFDFSFEYPSNMKVKIQRREANSFNNAEFMFISSSSSIAIDSIGLNLFDNKIEDKSIYIQKRIAETATFYGDNFKVIREGAVTLGGISGYEFVCDYEAKQKNNKPDKNRKRVFDWYIHVQFDNKLYGVRFNSKESQPECISDFQHVLSTWKWKNKQGVMQ
jgi:hypothetical protein